MCTINVMAAYIHYIQNIDDIDINEEFRTEDLQPYLDEANLAMVSIPELIRRLNECNSNNETEIYAVFCDVGKKLYGEKNLRTFFKHIYMLMFNKSQGARLSTFTCLLGKQTFIDRLQERFDNPFMFPM